MTPTGDHKMIDIKRPLVGPSCLYPMILCPDYDEHEVLDRVGSNVRVHAVLITRPRSSLCLIPDLHARDRQSTLSGYRCLEGNVVLVTSLFYLYRRKVLA